MIQLTPSSIGFLKECSRCLWLYYNEGIARPRGIFPSLPNGIDNVLKKYFDSFRKRGELPPELQEQVGERLYPDLRKLEGMRSNFRGLVAEFPEFEIKLKGAIDELLVNRKGEYVVLDFKTRGYPRKEDTHKHYQDQLDLYALLLQKNGFPPADYGYLLFLHPTQYEAEKVVLKSELVKLSIHWKNGIKIMSEVRDILNGPLPGAHTDCEFCMYRSAQSTMFG